jgi:hypothetical protein
MTPYEFRILLHYYTTPADPRPPEISMNTDVWRNTIDRFIEDGLLIEAEPMVGCDHGRYETTERAQVWLDAALNTPLPISQWVVPGREAKP